MAVLARQQRSGDIEVLRSALLKTRRHADVEIVGRVSKGLGLTTHAVTRDDLSMIIAFGLEYRGAHRNGGGPNKRTFVFMPPIRDPMPKERERQFRRPG
ncbi:MAG: hypothetical protein KGH72_02195 [Candidatus Micrarchaeota archaeon]|nr:hypothetical protein [Candidatus Micrarchaeota archaeon]